MWGESKMLSYIYDFLSILFDKLKEKEKIRNVILFGSFARGDQRKDSDIDLFIDIDEKNKEEISNLIKESIKEFEIKAEKSWRLKGIQNQISPIVDNINLEKWKPLKEEIQIYGITLYGKYAALPEKLNHSILVEYHLSKIKQKDKMKIIRKLSGYKIKKDKKTYIQEGLIKSLEGEKLSDIIIMPMEKYKPLLDFLRKNKISAKLREIYL